METTAPKYDRNAMEIRPNHAPGSKYADYPYKLVHWYHSKPGVLSRPDATETLGYYRDEKSAREALERHARN